MRFDLILRLGPAERNLLERLLIAHTRQAVAQESLAAAAMRIAAFLESTPTGSEDDQAAVDLLADRLRTANDKLETTVDDATPANP